MDPLVILFGFLVGVLVGLTGVGGGSLMTPILILIFGFKPVTAIGTDLAYGAVTKTVGGWRHWRNGTVDMGVSKWLAFGSVPGSIAGVLLISHLHHVHGALKARSIFGASRRIKRRRRPDSTSRPLHRSPHRACPAVPSRDTTRAVSPCLGN